MTCGVITLLVGSFKEEGSTSRGRSSNVRARSRLINSGIVGVGVENDEYNEKISLK